MNSLLSKLALQFAGRPIVVMGGGESLPSDLERCPPDAVYLSANEHGAMLRDADYIVCRDEIQGKLRPFNIPIIGPQWWCDYRIQDWKDIGDSGMTGGFVGWVMGGYPIILAGMGCYQGGTYYHDPNARSTGNLRTVHEHLNRWQRFRKFVPGAVIRSCSGPTQEIFSPWDPVEQLPGYVVPQRLKNMRDIVPRGMRTNDLARLNHKWVPSNMDVWVSPGECAELLFRRTAVIWPGLDSTGYKLRAA